MTVAVRPGYRQFLSDSDIAVGASAQYGTWTNTASVSGEAIRPTGGWSMVDPILSAKEEAYALALGRIEPLLALAPNWDSYGAKPIDPGAARHAASIVAATLIADFPAPDVLPSPDSGVSLEWHRPGLGLVISVPAGSSGEASAYFYEEAGADWSMATLADQRLAESLARVRESTSG